MSIVVTGATGQYGRLAVAALLERGVPAADVVATGRDAAKLADLPVAGRVADYDDPASLRAAFDGAEKLLFVSGSDLGRRVPQHAAVVEAAGDAGVGLVAYTSAPHASTATYLLAAEHRATEELLAASGLPHVILRNGWYVENYTAQIPTYLEHGVLGAAGDGRIAGASRADLADAAAAVLTTDGHAGRVYELGGAAFTLAELAAEVSRATGREVGHTDVSQADLAAALEAAGLPEQLAAVLADTDAAIRRGELDVDPAELEKLLGRPATTLADAVRAAL